jgi:antitoxin HigA-1
MLAAIRNRHPVVRNLWETGISCGIVWKTRLYEVCETKIILSSRAKAKLRSAQRDESRDPVFLPIQRNRPSYHEEVTNATHNPPHPGRVLREYLGDMPVSKAADHMQISRVTLSRVLNSKSRISTSMALRLAAAFGTTPELWINMQTQYDLWLAKKRKQPAVQPIDLASRTRVKVAAP